MVAQNEQHSEPAEESTTNDEGGSHPKKTTQGFNGGMLAMGIGVGTALGVALNNIPVGLAIGTVFGVAAGSLSQKKSKT